MAATKKASKTKAPARKPRATKAKAAPTQHTPLPGRSELMQLVLDMRVGRR